MTREMWSMDENRGEAEVRQRSGKYEDNKTKPNQFYNLKRLGEIASPIPAQSLHSPLFDQSLFHFKILKFSCSQMHIVYIN